MVFPPQQAATDLDKKETSHIHVFSPSRLKMSVKNAFSCFQSRNRCTVPPRHDPMALQSFYICRERWALVPCLCKSGLHVGKFFGASTSVLSTLKKCFVCVGDTMMCVCKFTNATLLHMLVPRRPNRAKPRVGRVE